MNEVWYLLYDGSSVDGMGKGSYCGRTTDYYVAKAHHDANHDNPYSIAAVKAITDTHEHWLPRFGNWDSWARRHSLAPANPS